MNGARKVERDGSTIMDLISAMAISCYEAISFQYMNDEIASFLPLASAVSHIRDSTLHT